MKANKNKKDVEACCPCPQDTEQETVSCCEKAEETMEGCGGATTSGLERYAAWYRSNEHWLAPLEQALQSAIWFIPTRDDNDEGEEGSGGAGQQGRSPSLLGGLASGASSEINVELLHSLASMWTVVNEQVLLLTDKDPGLSRCRSVAKTFPGAILPLLVATVEQFETVAECVLIHKTENSGGSGTTKNSNRNARYKWLCLIEAFKAALRLGQLYKSEGSSCMLLDGGMSGVGKALVFDTSCNAAERKRLEAFQSFRAKYLVQPMGLQDEQVPSSLPKQLLPFPEHEDLNLDLSLEDSQLLTFAELLHIFRPVVYCSLLWRDGVQSWRPWTASLVCELTSNYLTSKITRKCISLNSNPLCLRESETRWARLVLYLARSPFYDGFTRRGLTRVVNVLKRVPLLGSASEAGYNLLDDIQTYYTYTSG